MSSPTVQDIMWNGELPLFWAGLNAGTAVASQANPATPWPSPALPLVRSLDFWSIAIPTRTVATMSTAWPQLESLPSRNETVAVGRLTVEAAFEESIEYVVAFPFPPKRRQRIRMNVRSVTKGQPVIVIPEELL